jgi:hypothetical protein
MDVRERNDLLRTSFKGGMVLMTPAVYDLPAFLRGRALYRMSLCEKFMDNDHSEGVFVFAGYCFYWHFAEFAGELSITLSMGCEGIIN